MGLVLNCATVLHDEIMQYQEMHDVFLKIDWVGIVALFAVEQ